MDETSIDHHKIITRQDHGVLRNIREQLVKNWCLKRSRIIYAIVSKYKSGELRINIAMRCRENASQDWGHAWVTCDGKPVWSREKTMIEKPKTMIADTGKYVYWILN